MRGGQRASVHTNRMPPTHTLMGIEPSIFWCVGQHSNQLSHSARVVIFFKGFVYLLFRERWREKERERERNIDWLPSVRTSTRDQTRNPGTCPDQELNEQPFALQNDAQPTEPHQLGPSQGPARAIIIHFLKWLSPIKLEYLCFTRN